MNLLEVTAMLACISMYTRLGANEGVGCLALFVNRFTVSQGPEPP